MKSVINDVIRAKLEADEFKQLTAWEIIKLLSESRNIMEAAKFQVLMGDDIPRRERDYFLGKIGDLSRDSRNVIDELMESLGGKV